MVRECRRDCIFVFMVVMMRPDNAEGARKRSGTSGVELEEYNFNPHALGSRAHGSAGVR